jgi:hypothetical protein
VLGGYVSFFNNSALVSIDLEYLNEIGGYLYVVSNTELDDLGLTSRLDTVGVTTTITGNYSLCVPDLDFERITVGGTAVYGNGYCDVPTTLTCVGGTELAHGCVWTTPGSHTFAVPDAIWDVSVTMIGGGGGGGYGVMYMGGGGGSGHYLIEEAYDLTPGHVIMVTVGTGGGMDESGTSSYFGSLLAAGGSPGAEHTGYGAVSSAVGGDGGSGGGAGYCYCDDGGGSGSGIDMEGYAGDGGATSIGDPHGGSAGTGFGAGGGGDGGTSSYTGICGGDGGSGGGDGDTVGPCGGGGGGAGGLVLPDVSTPGSTESVSGQSGAVYIFW